MFHRPAGSRQASRQARQSTASEQCGSSCLSSQAISTSTRWPRNKRLPKEGYQGLWGHCWPYCGCHCLPRVWTRRSADLWSWWMEAPSMFPYWLSRWASSKSSSLPGTLILMERISTTGWWNTSVHKVLIFSFSWAWLPRTDISHCMYPFTDQSESYKIN